jgi:hypothetical protein
VFVVAQGVWDHLHLLYPTPETESAFLKNYTPISPLRTDSLIHRVTPLRKGLVDLTARIEQTETWFPKEPGAITLVSTTSPVS